MSDHFERAKESYEKAIYYNHLARLLKESAESALLFAELDLSLVNNFSEPCHMGFPDDYDPEDYDCDVSKYQNEELEKQKILSRANYEAAIIEAINAREVFNGSEVEVLEESANIGIYGPIIADELRTKATESANAEYNAIVRAKIEAREQANERDRIAREKAYFACRSSASDASGF